MSAKAERMRNRRHSFAAPGSSHDYVVGFLKIGLPAAIGALFAFLALAPLTKDGDVSFLLDKNDVDKASERMRVDEAMYRGEDNEGRGFTLKAGSAVQKTSAVAVVELKDLMARVMLGSDAATLTANGGAYDMDAEKVAISGQVEFESDAGYRLVTRDVDVDLNEQRMESRGPVEGRVPSGTFSANKLEADLDERTVRLEGRARFRMEQGAQGF